MNIPSSFDIDEFIKELPLDYLLKDRLDILINDLVEKEEAVIWEILADSLEKVSIPLREVKGSAIKLGNVLSEREPSKKEKIKKAEKITDELKNYVIELEDLMESLK